MFIEQPKPILITCRAIISKLIFTSGACRPFEMTMEVLCIFGTTLPTEGIGLVISGDIDGILANCESKVTPPLVACCSPKSEHKVSQ